jgi:hypothetical protein
MVGKIIPKSGILLGIFVAFAFVVASHLSCVVPLAYAAMDGCPDASLSFSQGSYNAGDRVTLNGANTSGTWTLCIYQGNERIAVTVNSTDSELSVNLGDDYAGELLTGVIHLNGICGIDLDTEGGCSIQTGGTATEEDENNDTQEDGDDNTQEDEGDEDDDSSDTEGDSNNNAEGDGTEDGNATGTDGTSTAATSDTITTTIENPLETDDFTQLIGNFLSWLLGIAGSIALLMLIYGGIVYISSAGDPQKADQGKRIVMWTLFGLIIILVSYSILVVVEDIFVN